MKRRLYLLDSFRGLSMLAVIVYHGLWDLVYIQGIALPWFESEAGFIVQRTIRWCFVLLAGFCCSMGSKPVKRALILLGCGVLVRCVSDFVESPIRFGVLTFLGAAGLLSALWRRLTGHKERPLWCSCLSLGLCIGLFILTNTLEVGLFLGRSVPRSWYCSELTAFVGFPPMTFQSADYVPLLPWIFAYGVGYHLYHLFAHCQWLPVLTKLRIRWLEFIGRHSLLFYLAHQPLLYGLLLLL